MSEQCSCCNNNNICIMQANSTIHPYHSIAKSKVHQNQPFLKPICYYIRIEERERKRKGRKEEKNGHNIQSYFLRTNPKSRLFHIVKEVTTSGIPKIALSARFLEFLKYGLFLKWTDLWNSNSKDYLVSIPIFGILIIWEFHLYQYLAIRVKCEIVHWYLEIPNFCHSVCFSSPTLYSLDPQIFKLHCLFYRN